MKPDSVLNDLRMKNTIITQRRRVRREQKYVFFLLSALSAPLR